MGRIKIDTEVLNNSMNDLDNIANNCSNILNTFSSCNGGGNSQLESQIQDVRNSLLSLSSNVRNIKSIIKEYVHNVEGIERGVSGEHGSIVNSNVSRIVSEASNTIINPPEIDNGELLLVPSASNNEQTYDNNGVFNKFRVTNMYGWFSIGTEAILSELGAKCRPAASVLATIGVLFDLEYLGAIRCSEEIGDGILWLYNIFAKDDESKIVRERIARDQTEDFRKEFYEGTNLGRMLNDYSFIKSDGSTGRKIRDFSTNVYEFLFETAAKIWAGDGLSAGLGASFGAGRYAEEKLQNDIDANLYTFESFFNLGVSAIQGWANGRLGQTLTNFASAVPNSISNIQTFMNTCRNNGLSNLQAFKVGVNKVFSPIGEYFSNISATDVFSIFGKAGLRTAYDKDVIIETAADVSGLVNTYLQNGEIQLQDYLSTAKRYAIVVGINFLANLFGEFGKDYGEYNNNAKVLANATNNAGDDDISVFDKPYSDYSPYNKAVVESDEFVYIRSKLLSLPMDEDTRIKVKSILDYGGYEGYGLDTSLANRGNDFIELQRRVSMARLLIENPETFDALVDNDITMFHGTNSNALPSVINYGLKSEASLDNNGIEILTGEGISSRGSRNLRDWISFTDVYDTAEGYSVMPSSGDMDSFPVIIGTSKELTSDSRFFKESTDVTEIFMKGDLPPDKIGCILVPGDKVEIVKEMVDSDILVLPMSSIDTKFYYFDIDSETMSFFEPEFFNFMNNSSSGVTEISGVEESVINRNPSVIVNIIRSIIE